MIEVLTEHYGYLSDAGRLRAFRKALAEVVRPGDTVVDIGSGFGILGLLCLEAGALHVWGIDRTEAAEVARETMRRAGLQSRYTCVHDDSRSASLPDRVDLVVCDHVGNFGLDYGIIEVIADARRRFLKPGGRVIPERITLQIAAVQSAGLRAVADAWSEEGVPEEFHWITELNVNSKQHYNFVRDEVVSNQECLGTVDLRSDEGEHFAFSARVEVSQEGHLDGLGGWFACEIAQDIWMTNSPVAPDPIKRCQVFLPFAKRLNVQPGDRLAVAVTLRPADQLIAWRAQLERTGEVRQHSTWKSMFLRPDWQTAANNPVVRLNPRGEARRTLLSRASGDLTAPELESIIASQHPDVFPTDAEISRFVRDELARSAG